MKKIDNNKMAKVEGGLNCFTVGLLWPISWGMPIGGAGTIIQNLAEYCWNS